MRLKPALVLRAITTAMVAPLLVMVPSSALAAGPGKPALCHVPSATYPTIQSAVNDKGCDVINVAAGTFRENVSIGPTLAPRNVTIRGAGPDLTIVDGGRIDRVFYIEGGQPASSFHTVTLKGMTITGGKKATPSYSCSPGPLFNGGGISSTLSDVTLKDCIVAGNETIGVGGGINNFRATLTVKDSVVRDNVACQGGGIRGGRPYPSTWPNDVVVTDSVIIDNEATGGASASGDVHGLGGGILIGYHGTLVVKDSVITGNVAKDAGGGIYNADSVLELNDSSVTNNDPDDLAP